MNSLTQPKPMLQSGNLAENWRKSRQAFEYFTIASGFATKADKVKVNLLLHILGEDCVEVFNGFEFQNEADKDSMEVVLQKFEDYYRPKRNVAYERHLFFKLVQTNESVDQFITVLRKQARNCEFGELMNGLIRDRLVAGVKDTKLQERLLRISDLTLEKAVEVCKAAEATESQVKNIQEEKPLNMLQKFPKVQGKPKGEYRNDWKPKPMQGATYKKPNYYNRPNQACGRCGKNHAPRSCPAYGKTCHKCQGMNHFASQCKGKSVFFPSQGSTNRFHAESKRRVHQLEEQASEDFSSKNKDEFYVGTVNKTDLSNAAHEDNWQETFVINNTKIVMKLDTGAQINAIPKCLFERIYKGEQLQGTNIKITAYGGTQVKVEGKVTLKCVFKGMEHILDFIVVNADTEPVLGAKDCERLGLISRLNKIHLEENDLVRKYQDVFTGVGKIEKEYKIQIDKSIPPVVHPTRKIPFKLQERLKKELDRMEDSGIISKVTYPTDWVNSVVIVEKPDGNLRICLDPRDLNRAIKRERYHIPTLEEISSKIGRAKYFSVLDARSGFWQIPLNEESQDLCTFNTPYGRYKFLRMPFGINSAPEIYQRCMDEILEGLDGVGPYLDDILVWGETKEEHDAHLEKTLIRARESNLKLKIEKTVIGQTSVDYIGHKFTKNGLMIDSKKVAAVQEMGPPKNKKELERFLGMVNYLARFIPNHSSETAVLRALLKEDTCWQWETTHDKCFERLKHLLTNAPILQFYDPKKSHKISADASEYGIGAVLFQDDKPVAYTSRTLTSAERNYAQIEKEILAITHAAEKFHQYIYGQIVLVETDHKPLEVIFKKGLNEIPPRVLRFRLRLQKYHLSVCYKPGKELYIADALSREPLPSEDADIQLEYEANVMVHSLIKSISVSDNRLKQFHEASATDETLQILKEVILKGWPSKITQVPTILRSFWTFREEIHEIDGLFFKGDRLIVPKDLQKEMLDLIHEGHMGVNKCKARSRECLFWPGISTDVERTVLTCEQCVQYQRKNPKEPLLPHDVPDRPWEKLGADLFEFQGKQYLLIVDYYSKYPEIAMLHGLKSSDIVTSFKSVFSRHGIPDLIVTDNGPQFASQEFKCFTDDWNFSHTTTSPHYPQSNGLIERSVQTVKKLLLKADDPYLSMLNYRNTPIMSVGISPAQILMGRQIKTKLPMKPDLLLPQRVNLEAIKDKLKFAQIKQKQYYDRNAKTLPNLAEGDDVMMESGKKRIPAKIVQKCGTPRSFLVETQNLARYRRNRRHLIKTRFVPVESEQLSTQNCDFENPIFQDNTGCHAAVEPPDIGINQQCFYSYPVTRTGRVVRRPKRFQD